MADEQTSQQAAGASSGQSSSSQGSQQASAGGSQQGNTSQSTTQSSNSQQAQQGQQSQQAQTTEWKRPAYLPDTIKTETDAEKFVRDHVAFKAAEDSRRLQLPGKPEAYKAELPQDFKPPQGIEFKINEQDPLIAQFRTLAHEAGLDQATFSKGLGLLAAVRIGEKQQVENAQKAEVDKLGVNGPARKTAVDTWLKAELGDDLGAELSRFSFTAKQIEGYEKLMAKARTQGAASPNNAGREPPQEQGKLTQEQYAKLPPGEKLNYARQFQQPATNGARQ